MIVDGNVQARIRVDLSQCEVMRCRKCGGEVFDMGFQLRKVSALVSPTGREEVIGVQVFVCRKCGEVLREKGLERMDEAGGFKGQ